MNKQNLKKRIFTSLGLFFLILLIITYDFILVYSLIVIGVLCIIEFSNILQKIIKNKINFLLSNLIFTIYIFLFCFIFFLFSNYLFSKLLLFIVLIGCVGSDIGGYIFGKIFKGPKLTKISPNKTITGAIGSIILTSIIMSFLIIYLAKNFSYFIILIAVITSIGCQLGDLFFSFLKRKSNLKDTGNILPGHGGILDRVDGILLGLPIGLILLILFY
jgi:phosphatidate cytidylyltransferase